MRSVPIRVISAVILAASVAFILYVATGCASSSGSAGPSHSVTLQVDNNLQGITGVTAFLVTATGSRRSLGPVNSNQVANFERSLRTGDYYLVAGRAGADDIASERFRIDSNVTVTWNIAANQLTFAPK